MHRTDSLLIGLLLTSFPACHCGGNLQPDSSAPHPAEPTPTLRCPVCTEPRTTGTLLNSDQDEASGLAASSLNPNLFYLHNDSGDSPRFFAINRSGGHLATFEVLNAEALDWEDMARGPASAQPSSLYFADTGNNRRHRSSYHIYRVPEPPLHASPNLALTAQDFPFTYPDGRHDSETLLIHPRTGTITIITKVHWGTSGIYEFPDPLTPNQPVTLVKLGEISPPSGSPRYTGGDVHPLAKGVLLRTYTHLFFYPILDDQSVAQALGGTPCNMPVADENQGEAVTWLASGNGYLTVGESTHAPLYVVECTWP